MVIEANGPKKEEKPGLLGLGYQEGDTIDLLNNAGIPNRVGEKGEVIWQVLDYEVADFINRSDRESYQVYKQNEVNRAISTAARRFAAALNGFPVSMVPGRWFTGSMPAASDKKEIMSAWQDAPSVIQKLIFKHAAQLHAGALQYLQPQLEENS